MPININDLMGDRRTIPVETRAGILNITYQPSMYSAELEDRTMTLLQNGRPHGSLAESLSFELLDWDLTETITDEDGEVVEENAKMPITLETLRSLPGELLTLIQQAINADMKPGKDETKNSDAGSHRAGKSANARNGTRR